MAKRYSADNELSATLALLADVENAVAACMPKLASRLEDDDANGVADPAAITDDRQADADFANVVSEIDAAFGANSPVVRFVQRLDDDIRHIIAQASDTEILSTFETLLRRLRLHRIPTDIQRRDDVLASRLVASLEPAARLLMALGAHRQIMKDRLALIENDLSEGLEQAKSAQEEATSSVARQLSDRQELVEAIIRHEADGNSLYHKLSIEAERGLVVLQALAGRNGASLAERFSVEARAALSPLLTLSEKNMLSMHEVERRKLAVDDRFVHRFNAQARSGNAGPALEHHPRPEPASA
ncbi:hypothetical protein GAO09_27295 [Rhizobiales bacterium RZME27]|uniref:Uncharacterized protein n=1 Tax=Endobacterium cereale TaxID=2663029 RepID=A0A6A8AIT7_9HYPH|nr:hypothetical protein [Endobacterium cereale]MEB2843009.1 hypothetical protein [Endobacterium cereale]MQY49737.1 hypothetical protein [Endobacterium cereale]